MRSTHTVLCLHDVACACFHTCSHVFTQLLPGIAMLAHTFPQAPQHQAQGSPGRSARTPLPPPHPSTPFWTRADSWELGPASAYSHLAVTWVTTPLLLCPPLVPGDSHVTSHTCWFPHHCLPHTSPLTEAAPSPGRKQAHAQLPRPEDASEARGGQGAALTRGSESEPPLGLNASAESSRP